MKSYCFTICCFLLSLYTIAQMPVQDKANKGQYQRMVYTRWDYWRPDPSTNFFGLPKDPEGWFYWRVLHHDYWAGEDRRPYKVGGQFDQNYFSLTAQEVDDRHLADSMEAVFNTNMVNYTNMQGGILDVPYQMYFKTVFDKLTTEVTDQLPIMAAQTPAAFNDLINNKYFGEYLDFLDEAKDRIEVMHSVLADRGERIVSYLQIKKELEKKNAVVNAMINLYINTAAKLPTTEEVKKVKSEKHIFNKDKAIVNHILSTFLF